jgi:hypothetical protein
MNYEIKNPRVANKQEIFWNQDSLNPDMKLIVEALTIIK